MTTLLRLLCARCRQSLASGAGFLGRASGSSSSYSTKSSSSSSSASSAASSSQASSTYWALGGRAQKTQSDPGASALLYMCAMGTFMLGLAYASVPLYRKFCQLTGTANNPLLARIENSERVRDMQPVPERQLTVNFTADTHSQLTWNFKPQQARVHLVPGETVLVFYTAKNPTKAPVTGIATYTVNPYQAAQYFNKIQCFCFEEQRLNPGEEVDMPVFFYIDPEYANDPRLRDVRQITLSYCFFEAKPGLQLSLPGFSSTAAA